MFLEVTLKLIIEGKRKKKKKEQENKGKTINPFTEILLTQACIPVSYHQPVSYDAKEITIKGIIQLKYVRVVVFAFYT